MKKAREEAGEQEGEAEKQAPKSARKGGAGSKADAEVKWLQEDAARMGAEGENTNARGAPEQH